VKFFAGRNPRTCNWNELRAEGLLAETGAPPGKMKRRNVQLLREGEPGGRRPNFGSMKKKAAGPGGNGLRRACPEESYRK